MIIRGKDVSSVAIFKKQIFNPKYSIKSNMFLSKKSLKRSDNNNYFQLCKIQDIHEFFVQYFLFKNSLEILQIVLR